jgi:glycosyltransferase involved in cell wall biosynthesis
MKPLLFVTGHAPAYRIGALACLHEREQIELALFGGRSLHGGPAHARGPSDGDGDGELPFPCRHVRPAELFGLAGSGRYRAVVCPTGGRLAPLATWSGTRRARVPLVLWASLWAHPRTLAHAFTYLPLARLYRSADAVVTYGPHVSAYVERHGARNVYVAPQAVDNDFWRADPGGAPQAAAWTSAPPAQTSFLFVGRPDPHKGLDSLLAAWRGAALQPPRARLLLAGGSDGPGAIALGKLSPEDLRRVYAGSDVLVLPSIATRNFREPWGLVVNEAMNRNLAVIASDTVGAAAGGLVRDGENGLVYPAGDTHALARAIARLEQDPALRERLGAAGAHDVLAYSQEAWVEGFSRALASVGVSRGRW